MEEASFLLAGLLLGVLTPVFVVLILNLLGDFRRP